MNFSNCHRTFFFAILTVTNTKTGILISEQTMYHHYSITYDKFLWAQRYYNNQRNQIVTKNFPAQFLCVWWTQVKWVRFDQQEATLWPLTGGSTVEKNQFWRYWVFNSQCGAICGDNELIFILKLLNIFPIYHFSLEYHMQVTR